MGYLVIHITPKLTVTQISTKIPSVGQIDQFR